MATSNEVTAQAVRQALMASSRWHDYTGTMPVMGMAKAGTMQLQDWTDAERAQAIRWAIGETVAMPEPMREYFRKVMEDA